MSAQHTADELKRTALHQLNLDLGAKMVPFAGYAMPVHYQLGILKEHLHTRAKAGLFDVSHMGQAYLVGPDHATTARALEQLVPADVLSWHPASNATPSSSTTMAGSSTTDADTACLRRRGWAPLRRAQCRAQRGRLRAYRATLAGQRRLEPAHSARSWHYRVPPPRKRCSRCRRRPRLWPS
jgi:glycine cleavage system aminomethyltransferase T